MTDLNERAAMAIKGIFVTRGKAKGMLLARAPASRTDEYAAWQGAMLVCNPYKASIAGIMFMTDEQREIMRLTEQAFERVKAAPALDRDRLALELMGAW